MGSGRFDANTWSDYSTSKSYATKSRAEIFTNRNIDPSLDPKGVAFRESRDSADNPTSTAIIIAQDVTGSMGAISEVMARKGVPTLVTEIYDRKPVTDPHVLCMAIGDVECDKAPLQVTQFEADIRIAEQLEKFYLEGGGGGNNSESYALAWYFAAHHTVIDCFEQRGKKGYLFTIGDEEPTERLTKASIAQVLGTAPEADVDIESLLTLVSRKWEVFHLIVDEGNYASTYPDRVRVAWTELLGQRAIHLADHTKLAEVIVSTIEVVEGRAVDTVVNSWDGSTSLVVANAVKSLASVSDNRGLVSL
jgi:hypothetical protein